MANQNGDTFHNFRDINGVKASWNSHPEKEFFPPQSDMRTRHDWSRQSESIEGGSGTSPMASPCGCGSCGFGLESMPPRMALADRTRENVLSARPGAMIFEGDLLPRADRLRDRDYQHNIGEEKKR